MSEPVRREQGSCLYCHAAHGGANAYDGLLTTYTVPSQTTLASDKADGSYAALCFDCHGGTKPSGFATAPVDIKQFATASGGTGGHSIVTSGGTLPVGAPLPCFECHNPHGSQRGNSSLLTDERGASLGTTSAAGVRAVLLHLPLHERHHRRLGQRDGDIHRRHLDRHRGRTAARRRRR